MQNYMKSCRLPFDQKSQLINIYKGIAIFLMLWEHCIQYCSTGQFDIFLNPVSKVIGSFHMPLFMMISGYLFFFSCKKRRMGELLGHRIQGILQPLIMCTIFNYLVTSGLYDLRHAGVNGLIDAPWLRFLPSLWFLWSVLAASIAVGLSYYMFKRKATKSIGAFCFGVVFSCLLPNSEKNLYMLPFFVLGFVFARYEKQIKVRIIKIVSIVSVAVYPALMLFYTKEHSIYWGGVTP